MTRSTLPSDEACARDGAARYESSVTIESAAEPGVQFTVRRMSFARRCELLRNIREIAGKAEFLEAGDKFEERLEAGLLACEVEKLYLRWGLVRIEHLTIDGVAATTEALIENGPEALAKEIVCAIQSECGLSETERKN